MNSTNQRPEADMNSDLFYPMTTLEKDCLARYNAERCRGIVHSEEWKAEMVKLQARHDAEMRAKSGAANVCAFGFKH